MSLDLEKQLCFYGAYHHNSVNIAIHITCVPLILAATLTLATNTPTLIPIPEWLTLPNLPPNLGTLTAIFYGIFYILLEPVAGTAMLPLLLGWTAYSNHLTSTMPSVSNKIAVAVEVVAWIAQFLGHGIYEGRAPALMDNLVQALVLAPFFVFMEILFRLGYRPQLQKRVNLAVEMEIQKFKNTGAKNKKSH